MQIFAGMNGYGYRLTSCGSADSSHNVSYEFHHAFIMGANGGFMCEKWSQVKESFAFHQAAFLSTISSGLIDYNWAMTSEWWIMYDVTQQRTQVYITSILSIRHCFKHTQTQTQRTHYCLKWCKASKKKQQKHKYSICVKRWFTMFQWDVRTWWKFYML